MALNLIGQKFGRVTVVRSSPKRMAKSIVWVCECMCGGKNIEISARDLVHSTRKGCGACKDTDHPLYGIWRGIIARCESLDKNYGGRGIKICPEWRTEFYLFVAAVGPRPSVDHSIDRIDVNGNYEPGNVRWANHMEQAHNKRILETGLTDSELLAIRLDKRVNEIIAKEYDMSVKSVANIKADCYSEKASKIYLRYISGQLSPPQFPLPIYIL